LRTEAKANKPKVTSQSPDYRFSRNAAIFRILNARHALPCPRAVCVALKDACGDCGCVALCSGKAQGEASAREHPMDQAAATLAIRRRLRQRILPHGELWRRLGEYTGGGSCGGCGERITSAQASYAVDFTPGVTPQTIRFHRACFEIWQCECQTALPS
jgi:hypothetical protein